MKVYECSSPPPLKKKSSLINGLVGADNLSAQEGKSMRKTEIYLKGTHFFSFWSLDKQNRTKTDVDTQSTAADISIFIFCHSTHKQVISPPLVKMGQQKRIPKLWLQRQWLCLISKQANTQKKIPLPPTPNTRKHGVLGTSMVRQLETKKVKKMLNLLLT